MSAQKVTAKKASSSSPAHTTTPPPNKLWFPYARYTSLVGVHAGLVAFVAAVLPRSPFSDFSSPAAARSKPRRAPLVMLTESPARTLVWLCLGSVVLQLWWAGWVRDWRLEASVPPEGLQDAEGNWTESEAQRTERRLRREEWDKQKGAAGWRAILATLGTSAVLHIIIVLFGAPLASHILETYLLSLLLATLTVYAPAYALGVPTLQSDTESLVRRLTWVRLFAELQPRNQIERALVYPAIGTVLGCWAGVIPVGLDWDRPWQAWPLTPAWGAMAGYVLGSLWAMTVTNVKEIVDLGISATETDALEGKVSKKKTKKKSA